MGGTNEAVLKKSDCQKSEIRFHRNTVEDEVHFHDDVNAVKCAIDFATYEKRYEQFMDSDDETVTIVGHDGQGDAMSVTLTKFINDDDELDIRIEIAAIDMRDLPRSSGLQALDNLIS